MESNNDILNRVRLLMEYDMSMTLTENLVLVNEQRVSDLPKSSNTQQPQTKLPSNIGYGKQPQTQKLGIVQYPKGYVEQKGWSVSGNKVNIGGKSVKEIVKNLRDFFFESPVGFATDIIISVAGAEVGGPLIMKALNFAFLANDLDTYYATTTPEYRQKGFMEKFTDGSNKSFQDVIVDLMVVGTLGAVRGISATKNLIKTSFHKISEIASKSKSFIDAIKTVLSKIPKIGEWLGGKLGMVSDFLTSLITKPKKPSLPISNFAKKVPARFDNYINRVLSTVPKNINKAAIQTVFGLIIYYIGEWSIEKFMSSNFISEIMPKVTNSDGSINKELVGTLANNELVEIILEDNPELKEPIKIVKLTENGTKITDVYYLVGNPPAKYQLISLNNMKLKKV